jgi:hypothetical protein
MHSAASLACTRGSRLVILSFLFFRLLALTCLAEATGAEVVSAGDCALFQRWDGAGEGGEAENGGKDGGEVDHFWLWRGRLGSVC